MFCIALPTSPYWLDLPHGVRVLVKPLDALVITAARNHAQRTIGEMMAARAEAAAANVPPPPGADLDDRNVLDALITWEFTRGLARYGLLGWENVGGPDGTALEFTSERGQALAVHPEMIDRFREAYLEPQNQVVAEGNASAASPDGRSVGAVNVVTDAANAAPTALPH